MYGKSAERIESPYYNIVYWAQWATATRRQGANLVFRERIMLMRVYIFTMCNSNA